MKLKMTRSEFVDLIDRAIDGAPGLTDVQQEKLREAARTTKAVGDNFNSSPRCPAGQAFGYRAGVGRQYSDAVTAFAYAYDDLMVRERSESSRYDFSPITVEITDAPPPGA